MNPLSPKYSATIASFVYEVRTGTSHSVSKEAAISGIANLFDKGSAQISSGTSGALARSRTSFVYAANGTGGRQGEVLLAFRGTASLMDGLTDLNAGLQRGPST